jgi:hypothetical protein
MLEHLGHAEAAADVVRAIERVIVDGPHTPDMKGQGEHRGVGAAVAKRCAAPRAAACRPSSLRSAGVEVAGPMPHTWITHSSPFAPS